MDILSLGLTAAGVMAPCAAFILASMAAAVRPWDGNIQRPHKLTHSTPYPVYWLTAWVYGLAERIAAMKPAPVRIAELSNQYITSQVLFSMVSLGVPESLLKGPQTAAEVAKHVGPSTDIEWLDRLMSAAAAMGMLKRSRISMADAQKRAAKAAAAAHMQGPSVTDTSAQTDQQPRNPPSHAKAAADRQPAPAATVFEYSLNAFSAALTSKSPVNMSSYVTMCEDDFVPFAKLAEGIRTGIIPYKLHTGGQGFWEWSTADPTRATRFDLAMVAVNHWGGSAVVKTFPWGHYDCVIDVAGGMGGFMADLMHAVPGLKQGVVVDLASNIDRAKELWSSRYPDLLRKVQLVPGDILDASTIPPPPADSSSTAYVLRNILHDWPDADCVTILKAIRSSVKQAQVQAGPGSGAGDSSSSPSVRLLIVEFTTVDEVLPCHLPIRHTTDLVMMVSFGDGKERNKQQFEALFEASGWRLRRITPTSGVFMVIEAEPV